MVQVNNFREFFDIHSKSFRYFGVIPIFKKAEGPPKLNVLMLGIIITFLMVYWTGVVFAFLIERHLNDKISIISNWIQMLGNSLALTTTLGATALKYVEFENIIAQFHKIDDNLMAIGHSINYNKHLRRSKCIFFAYLGAFGGFMAYDFYITIDKYQMTSVWYWVVSVTPLAIYSVGIYHAMFMIYWIKCRCSLMNKVLKQIRLNGGRTGTPDKFRFLGSTIESQLPMGCLLVQPREKLLSASPAMKTHGGTLEKGPQMLRQRSNEELQLDMNILSKLFLIMNDLCKLARKIDEYYGLFLLTSIGALFAITSIQVYYCYVTAITFNEQLKYSVWTLMVSVNLVTINLSLVVGLSTVCENVSNEATKILQNFSALQIKKDMVSEGKEVRNHSLINSFGFLFSTACSVRVIHLGPPHDQLHEVLGLWILHH